MPPISRSSSRGSPVSAGSARAAPIMPAPARSTPRSHSRTAWSGSIGAASSVNIWRRGAAPRRCSAPIRSRSRSRPATRRRWSWTSRRRSRRTAPSEPMTSKADRCRKAGCRTARTARRSPIRRRIAEGTYLPMGDYKGSGLSLVLGLLAGPLNAPRSAATSRISPRRPGARAQCRPVRGRARRRALLAARRLHGRGRPPHARPRWIEAAAGRRRNARAGPGPCRAPPRPGAAMGVPLSCDAW